MAAKQGALFNACLRYQGENRLIPEEDDVSSHAVHFPMASGYIGWQFHPWARSDNEQGKRASCLQRYLSFWWQNDNSMSVFGQGGYL